MASPNDVGDVIDPLVEELVQSDTNWFLVEFAPTGQKNKYELEFFKKGTGGLAELRENLVADDRIFYGCLEVDLVDANGSRYDKYVYIKYLPNKANKAKRHLWSWENNIKTAFKFKHVLLEYLDENLVGFNEEGITKEFLRVSENQMEYTSLDFGGNNIYQLKGGKVPPPSKSSYNNKNNNNNANANKNDNNYDNSNQNLDDEKLNEDNNNGNNDDAAAAAAEVADDNGDANDDDAAADAYADADADADAGGDGDAPADEATD